MLDIEEILATERMFDQNKLDVRTITMGFRSWAAYPTMKRPC